MNTRIEQKSSSFFVSDKDKRDEMLQKELVIRLDVENKLTEIEEREKTKFTKHQRDHIVEGVMARQRKNIHKRYRIKESLGEFANWNIQQ